MYLMTIDTNVDIVFLTLTQQERNLNLMSVQRKNIQEVKTCYWPQELGRRSENTSLQLKTSSIITTYMELYLRINFTELVDPDRSLVSDSNTYLKVCGEQPYNCN